MRYYMIIAVSVILTIVAVLFLDKWLFESVVNSGMPDWLKYAILR